MAEEHDKTHRLLFSFPRMVEDLIRVGLEGKWLKRLDFSTLGKVPERLLSPELKRREQDVLWRLRYNSPEEEFDWFYVYLHIEHQSRPRRKMSLYTTSYKLLALEDLCRREELIAEEKSGKLPQIFSLVFYTGEGKWKIPTSLLDEIKKLPDAPEGLDLWSYRLIDVKRHPLEKTVRSDSPLVGLFRLARAETVADLVEPSREVSKLLAPDEYELRQAFITMINEEIAPKLAAKGEDPMRITDLEEFPTMLEQTMDGIVNRLRMEGEARGEARGEAKGEARGEARFFQELFVDRFGDLPAWVEKKIAEAKKGQLVTWAKRLYKSERPEDVFD